MALQPFEVTANANVNVAGSEGHILQTDSLLTFVSRQDGHVDIYTTEWVRDNAEIVQTPEQQQAAANDPQAQRIAELEQQLADARAAETAEDASEANTGTPAATPVNPQAAAPANTPEAAPASPVSPRQQTA